MIGAVARKLFGSANDRRIRSYAPRVNAINALESEVAALSDDALKARTEHFKAELAEVTMKPVNETTMAGDDGATMQRLLDALENLDDVQDVFTTAVIEA